MGQRMWIDLGRWGVRVVLATVLAAGWCRGEPGATTQPAAVEVAQDVVYGKAGGRELVLDLSRPAGPVAARPCIVFIHGGGWSGGDKSEYRNVLRSLSARGYVAATVGYRLAPAFQFPAQVEDVKCAVRFLRANAARYGIDPDRIGAAGDSAGGHLAMMLGTTTPADHLEGDGGWQETSSAVQAVVSFYGPTDLAAGDVPELGKPILKAFLGGGIAERREAYDRASPVRYVHRGEPPMLLLQGTMDPLVPVTQAYRMADAMSKANVPGRVEIIVGAGHGFVGADLAHCLQAAVTFFDEHLRPGASAASR